MLERAESSPHTLAYNTEMCWDRRSKAMSQIHITPATASLFTITSIEYSRFIAGCDKENCHKISAIYRISTPATGCPWQSYTCTVYGEPASTVTLGKGLKHKQNVCICKWGIWTPRECNIYSGHIPFFIGMKNELGGGHRKVAYGISGATGIVHCLCSKMPMKNPCNNPRGQGHAEGSEGSFLWPASATTTGTTKRGHLASKDS